MSVFVGLMLLAFFVNVFFAKPNVGELASGFILTESPNFSPLGRFIGTTFVIAAAYYQSYLARFKGWQVEDLKRRRRRCARVSAIIMALITLMLMTTGPQLSFVARNSEASPTLPTLKPLFGEEGRIIFCVGLFCAAFSSFIVNSMIGGFILRTV